MEIERGEMKGWEEEREDARETENENERGAVSSPPTYLEAVPEIEHGMDE